MCVDRGSAGTADHAPKHRLPTGVARGGVIIGDARLETLYRYWLERRGGRAMPRRADIDPVAIYTEMTEAARPMYSENYFTRDGQSVPMRTRRVNLPLSNDGVAVDTILAGHVFEYPRERDPAFPTVDGLCEAVRVYLDETAAT